MLLFLLLFLLLSLKSYPAFCLLNYHLFQSQVPLHQPFYQTGY